MTREEFIEDAKIGDFVKIRTETDEFYEGVIVDLGSSGVKIHISEANIDKRIAYSRILEYDVQAGLTDAEVLKAETVIIQPQKADIDKADVAKEEIVREESALSEPVTETNHSVDSEKIAASSAENNSAPAENNNAPAENSNASSLNDSDLDFVEIRKSLEKKINPKYQNDISRINNILEYAKKVNEYSAESDRVRRAVANYRKLAESDKGFYALIGLIYHEVGDLEKAEKYYHDGHAYELESLLSGKTFSELKDSGEKTDSQGARASGEKQKNPGPQISREKEQTRGAVKNQETRGQQSSGGKQNSKDNGKQNAKDNGKQNPKGKQNSKGKQPSKEDESQKRPVFKGIIHFYNMEHKSGTIKGVSGGKIPFRIYQVKDKELQKILLAGMNRRTRVTYTRGLTKYGREAADRIAIDWDYYNEMETKPYNGEELQVEPFSYTKLKPIPVREVASTPEGERKAVEMMLLSAGENPFVNLPKDTSGNQYFQEAHRYMSGVRDENGEMIGIDLDEAEELFIKAIQAEDQLNSSVANLVNIYIKKGGENIIKGIQLLEVYGKIFTEDKLTNIRIQLIDKSGNLDALELILLSAIENCVMTSTLWQYEIKLAGIYCNQEKWEQAIEWLEKSLAFLDENESEFQQYEKVRNYNVKQLAITYYNVGRQEEAVRLAKDLLEKMPEDPVLPLIVDGTYSTETTDPGDDVTGDSDIFNLQFEDEIISEEEEISKYLMAKLREVDLADIFNKVKAVSFHLQDGRFVGNSGDLLLALDYIVKTFLVNKTANAQYRSTIYIGIAKLIYDFRNGTDEESDTRVSAYELIKYLGRYARYSADDLVERMAPVDSIRYMYLMALKYLVEGDTLEVTSATNMLIATFFVKSKTGLTGELHKLNPRRYNHSYYKKACVSVKDLLIATFMLSEKQKYVRAILESIFMHENLRNDTVFSMNRIIDPDSQSPDEQNEEEQIPEITSFYEYEKLWNSARKKYYGIVEEIGKEVRSSASEYRMVESIQQHKQRINNLLDLRVLWNRDEEYLGDYLEIIDCIDRTFNKYSLEEKIEGFRQVEAKIAKLGSDIDSAPTELSFDYIYPCLDDFRNSILDQLDELYLSSIPECSISLSNDKVYVKDNSVDIAITFCNASDKQNADAVEIELAGSEGADFSRCEMQFTSIRSGESQDYLAVFSLADHVIEEGQFDVTVNMKYQYREKGGSIGTVEISEVLPVNITSKENFVPIENKYNYIIRGSSVSIDTPELFRGRNELIEKICKSMCVNGVMQKNRGIILWGQRRVGKNSVKDYLKERIRAEYADAYLIIEVGSIGKCRNVRDILVSIVNNTEFALLEDYPEIYDKLVENHVSFATGTISEGENYMTEFSRFMRLLSIGLKKLGGAEKYIPLYFIDEFSYLYEWIEKGEIQGDVFMRFWKSFIQDYNICSIIIAQDNIPVWKSKYENEFACMNHDNEITYLDFEGAGELICEPCKPKGRELFAEDAVKLIYDWTKGSAYLIVIFCKHVIDYLNKNYTEKATKTIVRIVFEKEFIENRGMFNTGDFEPQIQDVANVGEEAERINKLNEELLKEIAASTIYTPRVRMEDLKFFSGSEDRELAQKIFDRLKERKIIEVERNTYCSVAMPLLKWYLLREQSLLDKDVLNQLVR